MEKISKDELIEWAVTFDNIACWRVGSSPDGLKFSRPGLPPISATELEARIKTADPELAKRFRAWYDATVSLGSYAHDRLEGRD